MKVRDLLDDLYDLGLDERDIILHLLDQYTDAEAVRVLEVIAAQYEGDFEEDSGEWSELD